MATVEVSVIKARQNVGDLYVGVMQAPDLHAMAETDRIRLESLEIPKYAGFQRALVLTRVAEIRDYLNTPQSTFPNAIIVSLDSEYIESWDDTDTDSGASTLKIRREPGALTIVDGQHRAAALDVVSEKFHVIVSFFVDLEMRRCAEIFAKINSTQKAVNPSIAFQLFGYAEGRSPQRTAHDIAQTLNTTAGSPFYRSLRMLGTKDGWTKGTLSQSAFANGLMTLYTRNRLQDENALLRKERLEKYTGYPLRSFFVEGNDRRILQIVWKFFFRVAETWPEQWRDADEISILPKTTGYAAFIQVLKIWLLGERANEVLQDKGVSEALGQIRDRYNEQDRKFIRANYPAGNQGVQKLRNSLIEDLRIR